VHTGVDADVHVDPLGGEGAGEAQHGSLAHRVDAEAHRRLEARVGGHEHDRAAVVLLGHQLGHVTREKEPGFEVDFEHLVPCGL
jgi:hypothetical protein